MGQKLVFVVKKEKNNRQRLSKVLFDKYPSLANRKVLIVDDECDEYSIGFRKTKNHSDTKVIAGLIDNIRRDLMR